MILENTRPTRIVDSTIYHNIKNLIEKNGITEESCIVSCELSPNFFNYFRNGRVKHFKACDIIVVANFFGVTVDYLYRCKEAQSRAFLPKYKLKPNDERAIVYYYRQLNPANKTKILEFMRKLAKTENGRIPQTIGDTSLNIEVVRVETIEEWNETFNNLMSHDWNYIGGVDTGKEFHLNWGNKTFKTWGDEPECKALYI